MSRKSVSRKSMSRKSMSRRMSKGQKKRSRQNTEEKSQKEKPFEEANVTIPNLDVMFILLKCREQPLVFRAVDAIYDYVKKVPEDIPEILKKDILNVLKIYAQSDLQYTPLRSLKLLAELSHFIESHHAFIEDVDFLKFLFKCYAENNDNRWKEPASMILTELTKNVEFCKTFFNMDFPDMSSIVKMLKNNDPDVVYNSLVLMRNIFRTDELAEKLVNVPEFMFSVLFPLFESQYIEVQKLALYLTHWLVYQPQTDDLKKLFLDEGGVDKMYNILLNKFAWRDLHPIVLDIIQITFNSEERVASLKDEGIRKLVDYLNFIENDELIGKAMNVVVQWSKMIFGRFVCQTKTKSEKQFAGLLYIERVTENIIKILKPENILTNIDMYPYLKNQLFKLLLEMHECKMLMKLGMLQTCVGFLNDGTPEMKIAACQFINEVTLEREKLRKLCDNVNVPQLMEMIINRSNQPELVTAAHTLFNNLIKFSRDELAMHLKNPPLNAQFAVWMQEIYPTMPPLNKRLILNTLSIIAQNTVVSPHFYDFSLVDFLTQVIQDPDEALYNVTIVAAETLNHLITTSKNVCQYLFAKGGLQHMIGALWATKNPKLREMLSKCMIAAIESDEYLMLKLLKHNCLNWFVKSKVLWYETPSMKHAVDSFFSHYTPVKFAYGTRLGFEDKIQDGFYVFKENRPPSTLPFPYRLSEIGEYTVYIVGFSDREDIDEDLIESLHEKEIEAQNDQCAKLLEVCPDKVYWHPLGYSLRKDPEYIELKEELTVRWKGDSELQSYLDTLKEKIKEIEAKELAQLMEDLKTTSAEIREAQEEPFKPLQPGDITKFERHGSTTWAALERAEAKKPKTVELITNTTLQMEMPTQEKTTDTINIAADQTDFAKKPINLIPKPFSSEWITARVQAISEIVVDAMTRPKTVEPCTYHTFNLFLAELKKSLESNVVPLGSLKVGMKLERALLFKVLADTINLPCTLVRGNKGQCWNEMCVMELDEECYGIAKMPLRLMYPTHVVDLWTNPGRLLAIGDREAALYCGKQLNPNAYTKEDWMLN